MNCSKCGATLANGAMFCVNCGTKVSMVGQGQGQPVRPNATRPLLQPQQVNQRGPQVQPGAGPQPGPQMQPQQAPQWQQTPPPVRQMAPQPKNGGSKGKIVVLIVVILVVVVAAVAGGVVFTRMQQQAAVAEEVEKYLSDAKKYLKNDEYDKAIEKLEKAIKVDPKCVEAYEQLAEAYVALGDIDEAIKVLEKGFKETEDEGLQRKIEKLEDDESDADTDDDADAGAVTSEPITGDPHQTRVEDLSGSAKSYDLDGDGQKESISYTDHTEYLTLSIDGTDTDIKCPSGYSIGSYAQIADFESRDKYMDIYVQFYSDSDCFADAVICRYENGKVTEMTTVKGEIISGVRVSLAEIQNGDGSVKYNEENYSNCLGCGFYTKEYNIRGNGLEAVFTDEFVVGDNWANSRYTPKNTLALYSDKQCKDQKAELGRGQTVKITKYYEVKEKILAVYVVGNGVEGWVNLKDSNEFLFEECENYLWG